MTDKGKWRAITEDEMRALVTKELSQCKDEDRALFEKIRIAPRKLTFDRGSFQEDVFAVAQHGDKVIFYDDIEDGFEVGTPEGDGVLRHVGCGQFELCHALAHIRLGWR